jgi:hypothetical protein
MCSWSTDSYITLKKNHWENECLVWGSRPYTLSVGLMVLVALTKEPRQVLTQSLPFAFLQSNFASVNVTLVSIILALNEIKTILIFE